MSKSGDIKAALLELLAEHERDGMLPTSSRFLFYELEGRGVITKEGNRPDNPVIAALTELRKSGQVPWSSIVDETRSISNYGGYTSVKAGVLASLDGIGLDAWNGTSPFVITESRSLAGALRGVCSNYGCPITATNGQACGFLHTRVRPQLGHGRRVLYMGDWDLAGNQIEANTRRVLGYTEFGIGAGYQGFFKTENPNNMWERIALTEEQVDLHGLPKITKRDGRYSGDAGCHEAVETEALSQLTITEILTSKLDELLPTPLEDVQAQEEVERREIRRRLR